MNLSKEQEKVIDIISQNLVDEKPITTIAGYAGSGKTFTIKKFIEKYNILDRTAFVTYTGKAALVLQQQGLPATTIHRLIYNVYKNYKTGRFRFVKKTVLDEYIDLIIIDEISMVPKPLLDDLLSFNIPVVCLGDPMQLPPIDSNNDNKLLDTPDYFLTEIHRQALDNPIIKLSMDIREGNKISYVNDNNYIKILQKKDLSIGMLKWADQIICATNNTRKTLNNSLREHYGRTSQVPQEGDKVICIKNYWDTVNDEDTPLINGTIGTVTKSCSGSDFDLFGQECVIDFKPDFTDSSFPMLKLDTNIFKGMAPLSSQYKKSKMIHYEFDYGYAITCHKAQGAQWNKVLVYEENFPTDSLEHKRWLYTAVTRASEKLVLIR